MNRREVIAGLALPLFSQTVRAQDRKEATIGFLSSRSPDESASVVAAFRKGLSEAGFVEGQNVRIVFRWAEGRYEQLPALAADLVGQGVVLIFAAGGPPAALAAKAATATIPIVFSAASDPVGIGLVQSLNRPGGNITGMSTLTTPLGAKSVELFKELKPSATVFAYLLNKSNPSADGEAKMAIAGASELGVQLHVLGADSEQGLEEAFDSLAALRVEGVIVAGEPFFDSRREKIVALAARHAVAAKYAWREYVLAGGLISYGTSLTDSYRQAAIYAGRILKGERPADLPVLQPATFELAINLKTAKSLGLTVPPSLLARADEVIE